MEDLERGREAYGRRAWGEAHRHLSRADEQRPLDVADLERLGVAAYLTGQDGHGIEVLGQVHRQLLVDGEVARAVRWACWLGIWLLLAGNHAVGGGWIARARRLLDEHDLDTAEQGYVLVPLAMGAVEGGDAETADRIFGEVAAIAGRFSDPDLTALGRLGRGRALVALGQPRRAVAMLDDAMVAVTTSEVSPLVAGIVYCAVIITCRNLFDWRRAQQWTAELSRWCRAQQDLQPYRGQCLVHRSEIMTLHGQWQAAMDEVELACGHLADRDDPVMGMARYQQAELLRLRGRFDRAEQAYREANEWGHAPQPGLALLRLAQGRAGDAAAAIRRAVDEAGDDHVRRCRLLAACVEVELACGEVDAARAAVDELDQLAADYDAPYLVAVTASARGATLLAAGDAGRAGVVLRRAWRRWQELDAPYEAARVRLLMGQACRELDDHDTAEMELEAARRVFEDLRAVPALEQVEELSDRGTRSPPGGLTPREVEVLALVATGATNRDIADRLVISDKTVARHLSNTFTKLDVSSRTAAAAYAFEHDLVSTRAAGSRTAP